MHEPPEDPVPSDPNAINPPPAKTKIGVVGVIVLMIFAMILPAACLIPLSFTSNAPAIPRLLLLTLAVFLLAFLGRIAQVVMRRRRKSGRWSLWPTDAERAHLARLREQRTPQQSRRIEAMSWLLDAGMLALGLTSLWRYLKPNHAPLDGMGRLFISLWIVMLAWELFTIYRKTKKRPTASD